MKWARRWMLATLVVALPVMVLSHGGFEHNTSVMALVGYFIILSLNIYDDIKTPMQWTSVLVLAMLALGIYEFICDPYVTYVTRRQVLVAEQCSLTVFCCPVFFFGVWYQLYYLRLEIEQRTRAEAKAMEESQAKANFVARMSHEIRSPISLCYFLAAQCQQWVDTAALITNVQNFPISDRGVVIGLCKAMIGMGAAILSNVFHGIFQLCHQMQHDQGSVTILLMAVCCPVLAFPSSYFIQKSSDSDAQKPVTSYHVFRYAYLLTIGIAFYLTIISVLQIFVSLGSILIIATSCILLLLISFYAVIPLLGRKQDTNQAAEESVSMIVHMDLRYRRAFTFSQSVRMVEFWLLVVIMFCGVGSGLMVINNAAQILKSISGIGNATNNLQKKEVVLVSLLSVGNALGRLASGFLPAYFHGKVPRPALLTVACFLMSMWQLLLSIAHPLGLFPLFFCVGFSFGSLWVLMPAVVSEVFGTVSMGSVYNGVQVGCMLGSLILSDLVAGRVYDYHADEQSNANHNCIGLACFQTSFLVNSAACVLATLASSALHYRTRDLFMT